MLPIAIPAEPSDFECDPARAALIVIDMQRDFLEPGGFGETLGNDVSLLAFGPPIPGAGAVWQMSEAGDPQEAATRLFAGLRWLDAEGARLGLRRIAVMPVPLAGLGAAINDRLQRAAAPR